MDIKPPQRISLPKETYRVLLEAIEHGTWAEFLPGERRLCEQFQVSRPTLRHALLQLEKEGVINNSQGCRREIIQQRARKSSGKHKAVIGLLCQKPVREMFGHTSRKVAAIEHFIYQKGLSFELFPRKGCFSSRPQRALASLVKESQVDVWILQETNLAMQNWFIKEQIPALVTGTPNEGVDLPHIDLDNEAICRHAVGLLMARGRRNICFVTRRTSYGGDALAEKGFMKGIEASSGAKGYVLRHDGTPNNTCTLLRHLLDSGNNIDGFLFNQTNAAYTVHTYLLRSGYRIPEDFALVCRSQSMDFESLCPSMACYERLNEEIAKRTIDLAIKIANRQPLHKTQFKIIPDLIPGGSLG